MAFIERKKTRRRLTPDQMLGVANYLTYFRILIVPIVVVLMMGIQDHIPAKFEMSLKLSWLSMVFFVLAQISDVVDGYYARKYGVQSTFGKFVDPLADKLLSTAVLIMLIPLGRVQAWMVVVLIAREIAITGLRGIAAAEDIEISASEWGKKKTLIQAIALGFLMVNYPFWVINPHIIGLGLLWLALAISVGSGLHYVYSFLSEVKKQVHEN